MLRLYQGNTNNINKRIVVRVGRCRDPKQPRQHTCARNILFFKNSTTRDLAPVLSPNRVTLPLVWWGRVQVAIDYQKSIRKKQCCIMITLLIVGVVIMAVLGVFDGGGSRRRLAIDESGGVYNTKELQPQGHWALVLPSLDDAAAASLSLEAAAEAAAGAAVRTFLRSAAPP